VTDVGTIEPDVRVVAHGPDVYVVASDPERLGKPIPTLGSDGDLEAISANDRQRSRGCRCRGRAGDRWRRGGVQRG
jgi:hypothetical protein